MFVQFFSHLSVQVPIISTLLALIYREHQTFPPIVVEAICAAFINAVRDCNIPVAVLLLRSLACLFSCGLFSVDEFTAVLDGLMQSVSATASAVSYLNTVSDAPLHSHIALYLLARTVPWCVGKLQDNGPGSACLTRVRDVLSTACASWTCPYEVGGKYALFYANVADSQTDMSCSDGIYEACQMAIGCIATPDVCTSTNVMYMPWHSLQSQLHDPIVREVEGEGDVEAFTETLTHFGVLPLPANFSSQVSSVIMEGAYTQSRNVFIGQENAGSHNRIGSYHYWNNVIFPIFESSVYAPTAAAAVNADGSDEGNMEEAVAAVDMTTFSPLVLTKHLIASYAKDILLFFEPYLRDDGTVQGNVTNAVKHLLALTRLFQMSSTPSMTITQTKAEAQSMVEYVILETLYLLILQVPPSTTTGQSCMYYYRVLLELCNQLPNVVPAKLASGIESCFVHGNVCNVHALCFYTVCKP